MNEGIPEVPSHIDIATRRFLTALRNAVVRMQAGRVGPPAVTNVKVTPVAAGNVIQFTRPVEADGAVIFASQSGSLAGATFIHVDTTYYRHEVGKAAKVWYWIIATRAGIAGIQAGPFISTSLAAGTDATIPAQPPATDTPVTEGKTIRGGAYSDL